MMFFLDGDENILGRYGGRDDVDPDNRQSIKGLRYAMQAAIELHAEDKSSRRPRNEKRPDPLYIRQLEASRNVPGCVHCHNVKEILHEEVKKDGLWKKELLFRYPPPDNLGIVLDVDRGNIVGKIRPDSSAESIGLKPGDFVDSLGGRRVRSFADAQYALDKAPGKGKLKIVWKRGGDSHTDELRLSDDWRRTNISWRPSVQEYVVLPRLYGKDLGPAERSRLGLTEKQLAFRHRERIHRQAVPAGVRAGDIILGFDSRVVEMEAYDFEHYVRDNYVAGDVVQINVIRDGKRINLPMTLLERPF